jgi:hypothetical protein
MRKGNVMIKNTRKVSVLASLRLSILLQDLKEGQYPLFLTSQRLMMMLDASLPNPYFARNQDGSLDGTKYRMTEGESDDSCT